jgi:hypothetical protein
MNHPKFITGEFDTHFVENEFLKNPDQMFEQNAGQKSEAEIAALSAVLFEIQSKNNHAPASVPKFSNSRNSWKWAGRRKNLQE